LTPRRPPAHFRSTEFMLYFGTRPALRRYSETKEKPRLGAPGRRVDVCPGWIPALSNSEGLPALAEPQNILIVRLSAIGDVVHVLPCLHALRGAFPQARIGWLVEELPASLLEGHPEIDDLFVIPKKRWRTRPIATILNGEKWAFYRRLRRTSWDVAIDFQGLTKSGWPAWLSGARTRIGFGDADGRELSKLFTNRRVTPPPSAVHVIQRNMALLKPLHVVTSDIAWRFPDWSAERRELAPFLASLGTPAGAVAARATPRFIAFYAGAGWETKRWPAAHFSALAQLLARGVEHGAATPLPILLVWGPGEEGLCRAILDDAKLPAAQLRLAPATNLRKLAALLEGAAVVIGGDTGPVHLAAALGVPVVGIYGGSDPARNGPWGERNVALQSDSEECRACWRTKCRRARRLECLRAISPQRVAQAVARVLNVSH